MSDDLAARLPVPGPVEPPAVLIVAHHHWSALLAHLETSLPNEGVALLATDRVDTADGVGWLVRKVFPGTNTRQSPTRYDMDPREIIAALREIDRSGWQLGAIVHTHPKGPPTPSPTDLAEAAYPESLMVIVSWASGAPVARAWSLASTVGGWEPVAVPIRVQPNGEGPGG